MSGRGGNNDGAPLLSEELQLELGGGGGNNEILMLSGKKKNAGGQGKRPASAPAQQAKLSKSQRRKLAKLESDRIKKENRSKVIEQLNAHKLQDESLQLLRGSDTMGKRETAKEKLRRALKVGRRKLLGG